MPQNEIAESDYIKAWVCFVFLTVIIGTLGGAFIAASLRYILIQVGLSIKISHGLGWIAYCISGIIISYLLFRLSIKTFFVDKLIEKNPKDLVD